MELFWVEKATTLAEKVHMLWIRAHHVGRHARAGHFVILRTDETGERISLTISAVKGDCVRFIFMAIGKTTEPLSTYKRGDSIPDILGLLGKSSEIAKYGTYAVVGGT